MTATSHTPGADNTPEVQALLIEMDALNAVLRVIEDISSDREEAIASVKRALSSQHESEDLTEALVTAAMQKIVGPVSPPVIHNQSTDDLGRPSVSSFEFFDHYLAEDTAAQWLNFILGGPVFFLWPSEAEALPVESAVHEDVLRFWRGAVLNLTQDREEARRLFKRAMELGAQFGTESHRMVSWSYAASFFTEEE